MTRPDLFAPIWEQLNYGRWDDQASLQMIRYQKANYANNNHNHNTRLNISSENSITCTFPTTHAQLVWHFSGQPRSSQT